MENSLNKREPEYRLMSLIYAYIISINFLTIPMNITFHTGGIVISIGIILFLAVLNMKQMVQIRLRVKTIVYILFIIAFYIITTVLSFPNIQRNEFYFYFALASFMGVYKCDYEKVLRYTMYISLIMIPYAGTVFGEIFSAQKGTYITMGTSFSMFPVFMSGIIHFFFFKRKRKFLDKICYLVDAFFLFIVVMKGNRGMVVAVIVTVFCLYVKNWGADKKRKKITFRLIVVVSIVMVGCLKFYELLDWTNEFLSSMDIEAYFIQKTLRLKKAGDVSNGRENIFAYTIREILKSPYWGHGIATIFYNSGYRIVYPHNFILQMFYDGGLLISVPLLMILYKAIKYAFNGKKRNASTFLVYMLLICIPKMTLSSNLWRNQAFWLMLAHVLQFYSEKSENEEGAEDDVVTVQNTADGA